MRIVKFLILLLCLLMVACGSKKISTTPIDRPNLNLPNPTPLTLNKVEFIIIHKDNANKVFKELQDAGLEPVIFGLTGTDYKSLAINVDDIKKFMILQREIIEAYRDYYESKETRSPDGKS